MDLMLWDLTEFAVVASKLLCVSEVECLFVRASPEAPRTAPEPLYPGGY
jgi:hypothetical protein